MATVGAKENSRSQGPKTQENWEASPLEGFQLECCKVVTQPRPKNRNFAAFCSIWQHLAAFCSIWQLSAAFDSIPLHDQHVREMLQNAAESCGILPGVLAEKKQQWESCEKVQALAPRICSQFVVLWLFWMKWHLHRKLTRASFSVWVLGSVSRCTLGV